MCAGKGWGGGGEGRGGVGALKSLGSLEISKRSWSE